MNATLFLDPSGWLAAISGREAAHERTRAVYVEQVGGGGRMVTTSLVLAEMHVLLLRLAGFELVPGPIQKT